MTNCSEELGRQAAARLGAEARGSGEAGLTFDVVVTAEEAGFYKSYSRPYQEVLQKLGGKVEGAVFVAESSAYVPGAMRVGMRVVRHDRVGLEAIEGGVMPERGGRKLEEVW